MLAVQQDLSGEQPEGRAEHRLFGLAVQTRHELFDDLMQQAIEFVLDLVLNGRQKTKIDKVQLVGGVCLTKGFRPMHGLRPPALRVALEELSQRFQTDALEQPGSTSAPTRQTPTSCCPMEKRIGA